MVTESSLNRSISQYFFIGFTFLVLARIIHYLVVTRYLRAHNIVSTTSQWGIHGAVASSSPVGSEDFCIAEIVR
jgi:hypothetical protein